jgi:hypothetical protein
MNKAKEVLERLERIGNTNWQSANSVLTELQDLLDMASAALNEVYQAEKDLDEKNAFYAYWAELYGSGLEIANWHQNGETEPYDNFFDEAEKELSA